MLFSIEAQEAGLLIKRGFVAPGDVELLENLFHRINVEVSQSFVPALRLPDLACFDRGISSESFGGIVALMPEITSSVAACACLGSWLGIILNFHSFPSQDLVAANLPFFKIAR